MNTLLGPSVAILLGTYNGERFLEAQLDSLEAQSVTQDDVWLPEKLRVAIKHIACESSLGQLYAYGGRTTYTDENLKPIGLSPLFVFPRTFRNALIQSIAGGNTMVFNQASKKFFSWGKCLHEEYLLALMHVGQRKI